jgi:hypothetical protein
MEPANKKVEAVMNDLAVLRKVLSFINAVWARSLFAIIMLLIGLWIGEMNAESKIMGDCKFAGAFRVGIQAFACQRRI